MQSTTTDLARAQVHGQRDRFGLFNKAAIEQAEVPKELAPWEASAYHSFEARVLDPAFPCFFAPKAHHEGRLVYAFADSADQPKDLWKIGVAVLGYLDLIDHLSGIDAVMATLIVFIKPKSDSVARYVRDAWAIMNFLHDHDVNEWPLDVPTDPEDPSWAFCFAGTPLFINISSPAHQNRKSRNLGEALTLVIQPREGFDIIAGDTPEGRKVRNIIRSRIATHDAIPPSPELGHFGDAHKREWKQYGLPDNNQPTSDGCPFHKKGTSK